MKASTRLFMALMVIEALLGGLWLWLATGVRSGDLTLAGDPADAAATISSTMGGAMGSIAFAVLVGIFVIRRNGN